MQFRTDIKYVNGKPALAVTIDECFMYKCLQIVCANYELRYMF